MMDCARLINCRYCNALWPVENIDTLADHEEHCALRISCPHCAAAPGEWCEYPSTRFTGHYPPVSHSKREVAARHG